VGRDLSGVEAVNAVAASESRVRPAVLLVDDVEANLVALEALLCDFDCELVLARNGNDALRQLLKREFAVMLLDVQMPIMDGYEVARHAHDNPATSNVPIVFVTATHDTEDNVLRGYGSGAVDFLFKPINSAILRSKVRVFLDLYAKRLEVAHAKRELEHTHAELAHAYEDLRATHTKLVQSAKMASLGELVAGIAHEINNPLAFAINHVDTTQRALAKVETLLNPAENAEARPHWIRAVDRLREMGLGLDRIRDLVVKLRTFSRLDGDVLGWASVRECAESVLTILGHRISEKINVQKRLDAPDALRCYPNLLNQALMNLVANAVDAVEPAGTIVISSESTPESYLISVSDDGPGIPHELRDRVYEPFFTTKPVGKGTGLGLSITYSIVQKHGGTLEISEREGGGTKMTMRIPFAGAGS
jgi:two-component system, NtrC family, sensor kinase